MKIPFVQLGDDLAGEQFISMLSFISPFELDAKTRRGLTTAPHLPILDIPISGPVFQPIFRTSLVAVDNCDVLFFDVQVGNSYHCNIANPGDPEVFRAMSAWHDAGFMRTRLRAFGDVINHIGRDEFKMNPLLRKSFHECSGKKNHLRDFQRRFHTLLQPGVIEDLVKARTMQSFDQVNIGFLKTKHTDPDWGAAALPLGFS